MVLIPPKWTALVLEKILSTVLASQLALNNQNSYSINIASMVKGSLNLTVKYEPNIHTKSKYTPDNYYPLDLAPILY